MSYPSYCPTGRLLLGRCFGRPTGLRPVSRCHASSRQSPHRPSRVGTSMPCPQSRHSPTPITSRHLPAAPAAASPLGGHPPDLTAALRLERGVSRLPARADQDAFACPESGAEARRAGRESDSASGQGKGSLVALTPRVEAGTHTRPGAGDGPTPTTGPAPLPPGGARMSSPILLTLAPLAALVALAALTRFAARSCIRIDRAAYHRARSEWAAYRRAQLADQLMYERSQ